MLFSLTVSSGIEIWRIENLHPVSIPKESHGKFFMGDSYIILRVCFEESLLLFLLTW